MTAPSQFTRRSARVEAMRLDEYDVTAWAWVKAHGVQVDFYGLGALRITDMNGARVVAQPGQWLALNPDSGEFTVWDEERFAEAHSQVAEAK